MNKEDNQPYIKPSQKVTELTIRAILLGAILSIVLSAANAYFGLFAGMTVSASIPAAVISMALLKAFKNSSILENNLVQTAASAGESLAAGVIFTIPALVLMGYWQDFNYLETTLIALAGGILGILFTIPLRKALIVKEKLKFPEGIATSEVLKTGESESGFIKYLVYGGLLGGLFKLAEGAMKLWHGVFENGVIVQKKILLYFGMNLSPALLAVGYIVGLNIAFLVFLGGAISWYFAIPIHVFINGTTADANVVDIGYEIWNSQIRYLGVGSMIVGGLWALVSIRKSLGTAFKSGLEAFKKQDSGSKTQKLRTELDTPMAWVIIGIGVMVIPIFLIYLTEIEQVSITATMAIIMVNAGFLFSSVAGYMAGLVGSSNNPISGVTIATILSAALLLALLMGTDEPARGAAGAILIGAVVCCAAAIAGDNMQDLKAGHILGSTPYKQQIMQVVGVVAGALAIAPVLSYLLEAYGMGPATEATPDSLAAPQAALMQSVAIGIFGGNLPWDMVSIGAGIGIVIIIIDQYLEKKNSQFRMPVLAVAVGIYLPLELDTTIFIGGLIAWGIERFYKKQAKNNPTNHQRAKDQSSKAGLLFASGLITGEALMGIIIAFLIVLGGTESIQIFDKPIFGSLPGIIVFVAITFFMFHIMRKKYFK